MTYDPGQPEQLPLARRLAQPQQVRMLALIALAIFLQIALLFLGRMLLTPAAVEPEHLPRGAFRPTREQLMQLRIEPVRDAGNAELLRASGAISADGDRSTPILLPYSGQVIRVAVEAGDPVRQGQVLLEIASPEVVDARNNLLTATAQQASAGEALEVALASNARQKAIYQTAGGAQKDYLQSQADLAAAQSNYRTAASALRTARDRLRLLGKSAVEIEALQHGAALTGSSTLYRSPVSGVVADRSVAPGQFITAGNGTPLMTITNPARVWLVAQLAESDAANVHLGDEVVVTTPALPGRTFRARIDNIAASLDPNTHKLAVRATVDNPDHALKPQMFASFAIQRKLTGGLGVLVPSSAVIHEGDDARVWVLGPDQLLYGRMVQAGPSEGGYTRILRGLRAGDRVVTSGALFVNEAGLDQ